MKYPISLEFFPYTHFVAPITRPFLKVAGVFMRKVPRFVRCHPALNTENFTVADGVKVLMLSPKMLKPDAPCLVYFHGGGFVLEAGPSHYQMAMTYALKANCKVAFVRYRLAPKHPFPTPQEDCYAALLWVHEHAKELRIDPGRIGVGGDSAGGTLAAACCQMLRDRGHALTPLFQLLIYPWLDARNGREGCPGSESYNRFTDTPMWNASLSKRVDPLINPRPQDTPLAYQSPVEAASHADLPPAYIEVAQFDCLHDDGVLYAELLGNAGVETQLHEVPSAMHGFDTKVKAPTSQRMIRQRAEYMRRRFYAEA
ncbi:MAG: alpha/beta hydrolase [Clostridia bacterium]|nr:alpha/beta hydrolase [Clostridia bacterium]